MLTGKTGQPRRGGGSTVTPVVQLMAGSVAVKKQAANSAPKPQVNSLAMYCFSFCNLYFCIHSFDMYRYVHTLLLHF